MTAFSFKPQNQPLIMGILNVTPDSFSDGNRYLKKAVAIDKARRMIDAGADIIDIGGESTRPGAQEVSAEQEIERVVPIIQQIAPLGVAISIDTSKPQVMQAAVNAGAQMINDVRALQLPGALAMAAELNVAVCLMHMQGQPKTMQNAPEYQDVLTQVKAFLEQRVQACVAAGINAERLCLDPGFGFGKSVQHNLVLLAQLESFKSLGRPLLVGISRKSMLGAVTGKEVDQRLAASLAAAQVAMQKGAAIIRVHDVEATVDVKKLHLALKNA